ncbi:MAG TPA: putative PEP-binding protein [Candidatus Dormibacteraeota bacterium]
MSARLLAGVSASPGLAAGEARHLGVLPELRSDPTAADLREDELLAARRSLAMAAEDLERLARRLHETGREEDAEMVATGALMAADPELDAEVARLILSEGSPAAGALLAATAQFADSIATLPDPLLAERADDVRSLGRRAARQALGLVDGPPAKQGVVVLAESLGPADVAELGPEVVAVALSAGGSRAHAAIVARSLGIPMVVGAGAELLAWPSSALVVVDGDRGQVRLDPDQRELAAARDAVREARADRTQARSERDLPVETLDGRRLRLFANAGSLPELREAFEQGAEGVGLLRTELLFLDASGWPDTAAHQRLLRPLLNRIGERPATVRLLDFGGDKTPPFLHGESGRGIELLLAAPAALRAQLEALVSLRAPSLRILLPMVTEAAQVSAVRALLEELQQARSGTPRASLGAMIEVPLAARRARALAEVCDFFSIGTNDLSQLQLGIDRSRPGEAPAHHPEVLQLIASTVAGAAHRGIPVEVCGEAASDPISLPLLVGLGVDELSVGASRVGGVRRAVRRLRFAETQRLAGLALEASGAAQVAGLVAQVGDAVG